MPAKGMYGSQGAQAVEGIAMKPQGSTEQTKRRVIIDTDPGIDDALAIFLAISSPELKIEALTPVAGNVPSVVNSSQRAPAA